MLNGLTGPDLLSRVFIITLVAGSFDAIVALSVQSVSSLGGGTGSVGKVWTLNSLGGGWNSVARI